VPSRSNKTVRILDGIIKDYEYSTQRRQDAKKIRKLFLDTLSFSSRLCDFASKNHILR